jgi:hypothetical protein
MEVAAGGGARHTEHQPTDLCKGLWVHPGKGHVTFTAPKNIMGSIRSEIVEMIDTAIERSQATTHGLIMSQFERLSSSLGQQHG